MSRVCCCQQCCGRSLLQQPATFQFERSETAIALGAGTANLVERYSPHLVEQLFALSCCTMTCMVLLS